MDSENIKIIVAEDDDIQRRYLSMILKGLGHDVYVAKDGHEALALVEQCNARLVISDLMMPGLDGVSLTQEIRKLKLDHYVHIIMATAGDQVQDRKLALDAGVDDFMIKPLDVSRLVARIRAVTRMISHETELAERTRVLQAAKEHIEEDLRAAAAAQRRLLPKLQGDILGFQVGSAFVPSSFVSGDMFGCFLISADKLGFYIVDVAGHGVHAALLSVAIGHLITPEFFRRRALRADGSHDPAALVAQLNERFFDYDSVEYFTMFCGVIDTQAGRLDYCQAGAPSPFYITAAGGVSLIDATGFPVGLIETAEYENGSIAFQAGDRIVLCSDGAIEAENVLREPFGEARLQAVVEEALQGGAAIPEAIVLALRDWRGCESLEDDLTVVALERMLP